MLAPTRVDGTCWAALVSLPNKEKPPACDMAGILSLGYFHLSVPLSKAVCSLRGMPGRLIYSF